MPEMTAIITDGTINWQIRRKEDRGLNQGPPTMDAHPATVRHMNTHTHTRHVTMSMFPFPFFQSLNPMNIQYPQPPNRVLRAPNTEAAYTETITLKYIQGACLAFAWGQPLAYLHL